MIRLYLAGGLLLALLSFTGWQWYQRGQAEAEAIKQEERAKQAEAAWQVEHAARYEERANVERLEGVVNEAHDKNQQISDAARRADRSALGLREYANQLAAQCRATPGATPASGSEATTSPGDLLAHMQRGSDEAAGVFANYADRLRVAAEACAASYPVKKEQP